MAEPSTDLKLQEIAMSLAAHRSEVQGAMARSEENHDVMACKMGVLEHSIRGNGSPGLNERVRNVENFVDEVRGIKKLVFGAIIVALVDTFILWWKL